jgi:hypothetical protein
MIRLYRLLGTPVLKSDCLAVVNAIRIAGSFPARLRI